MWITYIPVNFSTKSVYIQLSVLSPVASGHNCFALLDHRPISTIFLTVPLTSYGLYKNVETNLEAVSHATGLGWNRKVAWAPDSNLMKGLSVKMITHRRNHQWIILFWWWTFNSKMAQVTMCGEISFLHNFLLWNSPRAKETTNAHGWGIFGRSSGSWNNLQ
jgi:hypothetical protein